MSVRDVEIQDLTTLTTVTLEQVPLFNLVENHQEEESVNAEMFHADFIRGVDRPYLNVDIETMVQYLPAATSGWLERRRRTGETNLLIIDLDVEQDLLGDPIPRYHQGMLVAKSEGAIAPTKAWAVEIVRWGFKLSGSYFYEAGDMGLVVPLRIQLRDALNVSMGDWFAGGTIPVLTGITHRFAIPYGNLLDTFTAVAWDFGGGALPNTSALAVPTVVIGAPGTYNCTIQGTNAAGVGPLVPFILDVT